jgi:hypothetical protein
MTGTSCLAVLLGPWRPAIDAPEIDPRSAVQIIHQQITQQKGRHKRRDILV